MKSHILLLAVIFFTRITHSMDQGHDQPSKLLGKSSRPGEADEPEGTQAPPAGASRLEGRSSAGRSSLVQAYTAAQFVDMSSSSALPVSLSAATSLDSSLSDAASFVPTRSTAQRISLDQAITTASPREGLRQTPRSPWIDGELKRKTPFATSFVRTLETNGTNFLEAVPFVDNDDFSWLSQLSDESVPVHRSRFTGYHSPVVWGYDTDSNVVILFFIQDGEERSSILWLSYNVKKKVWSWHEYGGISLGPVGKQRSLNEAAFTRLAHLVLKHTVKHNQATFWLVHE